MHGTGERGRGGDGVQDFRGGVRGHIGCDEGGGNTPKQRFVVAVGVSGVEDVGV